MYIQVITRKKLGTKNIGSNSLKSLKVFERVTLCVSSKVIHKALKTVVCAHSFWSETANMLYKVSKCIACLLVCRKEWRKETNFSGVHVCVCLTDLAAVIYANCAMHNELSYHILFIQT